MTAIYRLLLRAYPREFRERYAADMLLAFRDSRRAAAERGAAALARFYVASLRDLLSNGFAERAGLPGPVPRVPRDRGPHARAVALGQDVRHALRMMWRRPAVALFAILTLALGLGAVTTVASLVHAVLLQPLAFPDPGRMVAVRGLSDGRTGGLSMENLADMRVQSRTLEALTPFFAQSVNFTGVPEPDRLRGAFVSGDFFAVVGIPPHVGRPFGREADVPGSERVAVITDGAWRRRFGAQTDIIGRQVLLNNAAFTIVGVMPRDFDFPIDEADVFLPWWTSPSGGGRANHNFLGIGRLAAGASVADAAADLAAIAARLEREYPGANRGRGASVEGLKAVLAEEATPPLALLLGMVGLVLIAACANAAGLQLGSTADRRREIAIRAALGAGRGRIVRQLLVESVVRAFAGAALGLLAAQAATRFLVANAPAGVHGLEQAGLRPAVVLAAAIVALAAGLLSGWPLALHWSAGDRLPPPDGGRSIGDPRTSRLRFGLAAGQVAMAAMLLVLVGLTVRSYVRLSSTSPGFEARGLLTLEYRLPRNKYPSTAAQARFHEQVLTGVRTLPGVVAAAGVRALPFSGNGSTTAFRVPGTGIRGEASANAVSPGYFAAMGIPLLGGRVFERTDPAIAIVVSRALAERAWAGRDPLGRQLRFDDADLTATVVGVVGDVRHRDLTDAGGTVYVPQDRHPAVFNTLIVRTAVPPLSLADAVRHAIREVDPDQPVWKVRTMETLVEQSLVARRFLLQLVAFFGVSAGVLSVVGLYGVIAVDVARRRQEIGLRMALGATRGAVLIMILRSGMRVSVAGIGCGLLGALTAAQLVQRFLFGISARDPLTFGLVGVLLAAAALAACWLPARRAMRVDPVLPLRAA